MWRYTAGRWRTVCAGQLPVLPYNNGADWLRAEEATRAVAPQTCHVTLSFALTHGDSQGKIWPSLC